MNRTEFLPGFAPERSRAPALTTRADPWFDQRRSARITLITAVRAFLWDRYWQCLGNLQEISFADPVLGIKSFHILTNQQLELLTNEFMHLGVIPVRTRPDGLAPAYVRLLHEMLHTAEHSNLKDPAQIEGATQYLAIYAYLGEVPEPWINIDFGESTTSVADRIRSNRKFTVYELARGYFGHHDLNDLFSTSEENSGKSRKDAV